MKSPLCSRSIKTQKQKVAVILITATFCFKKWGELSVFLTVQFWFAQCRQSAPDLFEYTTVKYFSLQISMRGNSFHQQLAKKISSTDVTSDLSVVWYLGLWNKCHLIHGSFSGNPEDPRTERTRSRLARALSRKRRIHLVIHGKKDLTQTEKGPIKRQSP